MRAGRVATANANAGSAFEPVGQRDAHAEHTLGAAHALYVGAAPSPRGGHFDRHALGTDITTSGGDGERDSTADARSRRERVSFAGNSGESDESAAGGAACDAVAGDRPPAGRLRPAGPANADRHFCANANASAQPDVRPGDLNTRPAEPNANAPSPNRGARSGASDCYVGLVSRTRLVGQFPNADSVSRASVTSDLPMNLLAGPGRPRQPAARAAFAFVGLVVALVVVGCAPFVDPESVQNRADTPAGVLGGNAFVGETFTATCNGLSAVDMQVAAYPTVLAFGGQIRLTVDAQAPTGLHRLATSSIEQRVLAANQWVDLSFNPVPNSRGQTFVLTATSTAPAPAAYTLWASSHVDVPGTRRFENAHDRPGALTIRASCAENAPSIVQTTMAMIGRAGWLWPVALALGLLPGLGLVVWTNQREADVATLLGYAAGWSVMIAPLALVAASTVGVGGAVGPLTLAGGVVGLMTRWWWVRSSTGQGPPDPLKVGITLVGWTRSRVSGPAAIAILATLGAVVVRTAIARHLVLPMWVDSVQHSYIAQLIVENGRVPVTYGSAMPTEPFDYHFGFHAIAASASQLAGASVPSSILASGQILGVMVPLATYALGRDLLGSARPAAVAALLVGVVTTQPTYLVTWGRYPELAGLVALPAVFASVRAALDNPPSLRSVGPAIAATAAMPLVHPRVAVFLAALVVAYLGSTSIHWRRKIIPRLVRTAALAAASSALIAPWLARLWLAHHAQLSPMDAPKSIDFPFGFVTAGNDRYVLALALVGLAVAAIVRIDLVALIATWAALVVVAANPASFGLPFQLWINNDSVAIALFLPATILAGYAISRAADLVRFAKWSRVARITASVVVVAAAFYQLPSLLTVVNPCCYIGKSADLAAMSWIRANTPADARFVVNGYQWSKGIWAGSDAGYWLPVLADRPTTLPPLFYATGPSGAATAVNATASQIEAGGADPSHLFNAAKLAGARFVYVGTQGGPIDPYALAEDPRFRLLYRAGGAWVFEVGGGGSSS
jgi:hypothetical protein